MKDDPKSEFKSYGLKFKPILKDKIWGGAKLKSLLNKPASEAAGESWEISTVENEVSEVQNGVYKGLKLDVLIERFQSEILGDTVIQKFGGSFPLLIKFIDAAENLSIQVHPGDAMANKYHNSFGKTEMWYVMQADEGAQINVGWKNKISPEEYKESLENGRITDHLNFVNASEGDTFFIKAGKVHAIGAGVMLAEIQQTSDVTYRVYDWDRVDDEGNSRELHIDKAGEAMNFEVVDDHTVQYNSAINESSNLVACDYFKTNIIEVQDVCERDYSTLDSFVVFICVKGSLTIIVDGEKERISSGQTLLIPAVAKLVTLIGDSSKVLEVLIED